MSVRLLLSSALVSVLPSLAATAPEVIADIAPVHSLVARVMEGVGDPALLVPPGQSPHDYALRPSDAARLDAAGIVIWTGEGLVPWLTGPLATLAPDAVSVALLESPGWTTLPRRTDPAFEAGHDHGHEDHGHEDHAHDDHDHGEHAHDDHDDHGHDAHGDHADHDHGATDPHAWLDPVVAAAWGRTIAETLAAADPDNAATYRANAEALARDLDALTATITAEVAPLRGRGYVVAHDAFQYFETRFDLPASGAVALTDATAPGPARIAALRDLVASGGVVCVLTDPATDPAWSDLIREGTAARTALADAEGVSLDPGPDLYPALLTGLAAALTECLAD